ncbi:MAG: SH3 domain-containing protein [Anaerolineales bacterium]|uniref:SH3 domain-containing protein n=1 Tax=Promineifilum sp. TaxID=2664178 RepID=UPI001E00484D|nr:SH3 domain-containing protein [Anaerolineales bacterium]MCO5179487.1 SH3 domain-containing protein [Promineifilum sp.]
MGDRRIVGMGIVLLLSTSLACNAFAGRGDSLPPPPIPTAAPESAATPGESNLAPTVTLPADAPVEQVDGTVRILVDLNIRSGPGVRFDRVGFLLRDERAVVVGRDPQSGWWRIQCPANVKDVECWVSGGSQFTLLESGQ